MLAHAYAHAANEDTACRTELSQPPVRDPLDEHMTRGALRTVEAKEHLFCDGDRASHVYRVEVGHLCIYRMMPDGRRQVVDFAYPGDIVGLGALGEHGENAQAMERTIVRAVAHATLRDFAATDGRLSRRLYEVLSRELMAARELLFTVSQRTAAERVAAFLVALAQRSRLRGETPDEIVLPMSRIDIADFLGLTIETVSRTLTKFRQDAIIDLEHCILVSILDPDALAAMAEGRQMPKGGKLDKRALATRRAGEACELAHAG